MGFSATAQAAHFCVNTVAQLQNALTTAATNGADDVIRVRTGIYLLTQRLVFDSSEAFDLTLEGGYLGVTCANQSINPSLTVLDGDDQTPLLTATSRSATGNLTIRNFTWRNGWGGGSNSPVIIGANLDGPGDSGTTTVEWNHFRDNHSEQVSTLNSVISISSGRGNLKVRNNLFAHTSNTTNGAGVAVMIKGVHMENSSTTLSSRRPVPQAMH